MSLLEDVVKFNWTPWLMLGSFVVGIGSGSVANGWRLGEEMERIKAEQFKSSSDEAKKALSDLAEASKNIRDRAKESQVDVSSLNDTLAKLRKDFQNEKLKPLPVDCKPDAIRVLKLSKTIDAVNKTVSGPEPSGSVPPGPKAVD